MARGDDPQAWMWSEAVAMLTRAENMHRQFFRPTQTKRQVAWEPPVDILELQEEVLILVALPGVDPKHIETAIDNGVLLVSGRRVLPPELRTAVIHRLELPQGHFERRVPLPAGRYAGLRHSVANGCLVISLRKAP